MTGDFSTHVRRYEGRHWVRETVLCLSGKH